MAVCTLYPARVWKFLVTVAVILAAAHAAGAISAHVFEHRTLFGLVKLFNMDKEYNVPSVFASQLFLACAVTLAVISGLARKASRKWAGLACIFLFLCFDELVSVHEQLTVPMRELLGAGGVLYYAWIVPYLLLMLVAALIYLPFLIRLPRRTRSLMAFSAVLFVSGAVGMEMLSGLYADVTNMGRADGIYATLTLIEEFLELLGLITFLYTLLDYVRVEYGSFRFDLPARRYPGFAPSLSRMF